MFPFKIFVSFFLLLLLVFLFLLLFFFFFLLLFFLLFSSSSPSSFLSFASGLSYSPFYCICFHTLTAAFYIVFRSIINYLITYSKHNEWTPSPLLQTFADLQTHVDLLLRLSKDQKKKGFILGLGAFPSTPVSLLSLSFFITKYHLKLII